MTPESDFTCGTKLGEGSAETFFRMFIHAALMPFE
jgi:hypothetical protein